MKPTETLRALRAAEVQLIPTPDGWRLRGSMEALSAIGAGDFADLKAALVRRRAAMEAQRDEHLAKSRCVPFLVAVAGPFPLGRCSSCGDELLDQVRAGDRCPLCVEAAFAARPVGLPLRGICSLNGRGARMDNTTNTAQPVDEPLWTAEDVAAYLRISLSMVYKLRRTGRLPGVAIGALHRFNPDQVRAFGRGELGAPARKIVPLR